MQSPTNRALCRISAAAIDTREAMEFVATPASGGVAVFVGVARTGSSVAEGRTVVRLEYETYTPMAEEMLAAIAGEVLGAHAIDRLALLHRCGSVAIGEAAMIVSASARHRAPAFDACREAVEAVKARLPVWKKEVYSDGGQWVGSGA